MYLKIFSNSFFTCIIKANFIPNSVSNVVFMDSKYIKSPQNFPGDLLYVYSHVSEGCMRQWGYFVYKICKFYYKCDIMTEYPYVNVFGVKTSIIIYAVKFQGKKK